MNTIWNRSRKMVVCAAAFCLVTSALQAARAQDDEANNIFRAGYATPRVSEAVRVLQRIRPQATLRQIKAVLPASTRYQRIVMSPMGDWKWNTLRFKGRYSGILVFANNRRKYRTSEADKNRAGVWRASDAVHSVDVFLGPEASSDAAQVTRETKAHVETIARVLGRRGQRDYLKPGDGPGGDGWSAVWKLRDKRELYFAHTLSYSEGEVRPMLQLSFAYSHLYRD